MIEPRSATDLIANLRLPVADFICAQELINDGKLEISMVLVATPRHQTICVHSLFKARKGVETEDKSLALGLTTSAAPQLVEHCPPPLA